MEPTGVNLSQADEVSKGDNDIGGACLAMHDNNNSHSSSPLRDNETLTQRDKDKETEFRDNAKSKDEYCEGSEINDLEMKPEQNDEGDDEDPTSQSYVVKLRKRPNTITAVDNGNKRMSDSLLFAKKYSFPTSEDFTVSNSGDADTVRITGYLEKRSKLLGWKKFWCVLDGRLLTYYKSKVDYDSLVACSGSINLGIASTVRPVKIRGCKGYPIQIVTRTQVYYLRSQDKQILEQWLIAIQEAASSQPKISFPIWADPGSQFFRYSFAASSQWSLDNSNENITESLSNLPLNFFLKKDNPKQTVKTNLQKCHSFASLQAPTSYNSSYEKDTISNTSVQRRSRKGPAPPPPQSQNPIPIRHSVSMLMLDSSPAAAELKKELTRKLSAENKSPNNNCTKPSSLNNKQKNELPFLIKSTTPDLDGGGSHHYDEIVDFEAIYENMSGDDTSSTSTRRTSNISSEQNDTGIYESVDAMSDSWSKLDTDLKNGQSKTSLNHKASVESGPGRTFSISASADEAKSHIDAIRNFPLMPDSETSRILQTNANMDSDTSSCTSYPDSVMMTEGEKLKTKPKKKHFSNFFSKIFNKDKSKKALKVQTSNMVITGPVDLRSLHQQSQPTAMTRPSNLPIEKVNTSPETIIKPPSIIGTSSPLVSPIVIEELRKKINRTSSSPGSENSLNRSLRRNGSLRKLKDKILNNGNDNITTLKETKQTLAQIVDRSPEKDLAHNRECNDTIAKPLVSALSEEKDEFTVELRSGTVRRTSEDFQQKLAKFNRLSQTLNSSFVAALNPPPLVYSTLGPMGRSKSWRSSGEKTTTTNEVPPMLPPKKKAVLVQVDCSNYDTPLNNRPISKTSFKDDAAVLPPKEVEDASISSFIRSLNKKNSAPEIMFAGIGSLPNVSQESDKIEAEKVFKEICSVPPPIPPKPSSASPTSAINPLKPFASDATSNKVQPSGQQKADVKTLNLNSSNSQQKASQLSLHHERNNAESTAVSGTQLKSNPQSMTMNAEISPSISHKSADFLENLEILSDLSDTNISITPPGTPKRNQSSTLQTQTPNDDQDSLMSTHTGDSSLRFTEDSLSNTPESLNKDDMQNPLQIFILGDNKQTPEGIKKSGESVLMYARQNNQDSKDSLELSSLNSQSNSENDKFYENLRFATVDTIIQEFETVEETEDEISEMYDDFPTEFLAPVNLSGFSDQDEPSSPPTSLASCPLPKNSINDGSFADPRHSGIDQLQEYLNMEMNSKKPEFNEQDETTISMIPPFKKTLRQGAVSRLGHSSAVDQLQRVLRTRNDL